MIFPFLRFRQAPAFLVVGRYQEEVLAVEGRGGGIGLVDDVVGDSGLPKNLSFHGKGGGMSGSVVKET